MTEEKDGRLTRVRRKLIESIYLWNSAKWIRRAELIAADRSGFSEQRGYHDRGDPWREERYG